MRIGMIGFGTVGQGVAELLRRHGERYTARLGQPAQLSAVLVRDTSRPRDVDPPDGCLLTDDEDAFFDRGFDVLCEVAGGVDLPLRWITRALEQDLDVVTANKALLATRGEEIFALAREHSRRVGFEASVAGGVPLLGVIHGTLAANRIDAVTGIFNGTCNYLLTRMASGESSFEHAVSEAQRLGYAEADPSLDVSGRDSLEKLAIVAAVAFGSVVAPEAIASAGVEEVGPLEMDLAAALDMAIKPLASARRTGDGLALENGPFAVDERHPLASVVDAEMGALIEGDAMARTFIAGSGAGRFPTASAVVADLLAVGGLRPFRDTPDLNIWPDAADGPPSAGDHEVETTLLIALGAEGAERHEEEARDAVERAGGRVTRVSRRQGALGLVAGPLRRSERAALRTTLAELLGPDARVSLLPALGA